MCSTVTEIPLAECQALPKLHSSTNGPGWTTSNGWLSINTPCNWYGVICDIGSPRHVIQLSLASNRLSGTLPPELGRLTDLQVLGLSSNQLTGSIPSELEQLTNLLELSLNNNQLSGALPQTLGQMTDLQYLDLSSNQLSGRLPCSLANRGQLGTLYIDTDHYCVPPDAAFQRWFANLPVASWDAPTC
jgi:Leucine-rich repeat (LRR) protein